MLRLRVVQRLAWRLADLGIMRVRIEETFKRRMMVRGASADGSEEVVLAEVRELEPRTMHEARSASR